MTRSIIARVNLSQSGEAVGARKVAKLLSYEPHDANTFLIC